MSLKKLLMNSYPVKNIRIRYKIKEAVSDYKTPTEGYYSRFLPFCKEYHQLNLRKIIDKYSGGDLDKSIRAIKAIRNLYENASKYFDSKIASLFPNKPVRPKQIFSPNRKRSFIDELISLQENGGFLLEDINEEGRGRCIGKLKVRYRLEIETTPPEVAKEFYESIAKNPEQGGWSGKNYMEFIPYEGPRPAFKRIENEFTTRLYASVVPVKNTAGKKS